MHTEKMCSDYELVHQRLLFWLIKTSGRCLVTIHLNSIINSWLKKVWKITHNKSQVLIIHTYLVSDLDFLQSSFLKHHRMRASAMIRFIKRSFFIFTSREVEGRIACWRYFWWSIERGNSLSIIVLHQHCRFDLSFLAVILSHNILCFIEQQSILWR